GVNHGTTDGCDGTEYFNLILPFSDVFSGSSFTSLSICNGDSIILSASNGSNYLWSPSSGLSCTTCQSPVANPNSTTIYTVHYQNGGCDVTDTFQLIVNEVPSLLISNDTVICEGASVQLQAASNNSVVWSPASGLSCTLCSDPVANPSASTTYFAVA